ncbi:hypothetical protein RUM44_008254 [Polyplax serrata]|uniref:Uncharacterized protein n=1 Tax=Polyplax serrata TaxID=468196 RepID=A0ABR1BBY1_POLSC
MIFVQFFTGTLGLLRGTASKIVVNNGAPRTGTGEEAEKKNQQGVRNARNPVGRLSGDKRLFEKRIVELGRGHAEECLIQIKWFECSLLDRLEWSEGSLRNMFG